MAWGEALTVALAVAIALLWAVQFRAPALRGEVPVAVAEAHGLLGDLPRPVGSTTHADVRARLEGALRAHGAEVETHASLVCGPRGRCARVQNLLARLGPSQGPAVAVVAHYDSVASAPGAADDGVGVAAILALARRYGRTPPSRSLLLVLTDGEELGLLGARALERDATLGRLAALINIEARGTSGPSLLFETSGPTGPVVRRFAQVVRRPLTSSLFDAVYAVLPNDTDLSVLRSPDLPAYNLAFIGTPLGYHTAQDSFDALSAATAAHHLEQVEALVAALLQTPLGDGGDIVWFDLFGLWVVWIPQWAAAPLAAGTLLALSLWARRSRASLGQLAGGAGLALGVLGVAAAVGWAVAMATHGSALAPWRIGAGWVQTALIGSGLAVGLWVPRLGARGRALGSGVWLGGVGVAALLGLGVAVLLPGASHLWVVPVAVASVGVVGAVGLGGDAGRWLQRWSPHGAALATWTLWCPALGMLYGALGAQLAAVVTVAAALSGAWFGSALRGRPLGAWLAVAATGAACVGLLGAVFAPSHDAVHPGQANVVVRHEAGVGTQIALQGAQVALPGLLGPVSLPPPFVERQSLGPDRTRLRVTSQRGAPTVGLRWRGTAEVTVEGRAVQPARSGDLRWVWVYGAGAQGASFVIAGHPEVLWATDETLDLPVEAVRPAAVQAYGLGDRTQVRGQVLPD